MKQIICKDVTYLVETSLQETINWKMTDLSGVQRECAYPTSKINVSLSIMHETSRMRIKHRSDYKARYCIYETSKIKICCQPSVFLTVDVLMFISDLRHLRGLQRTQMFEMTWI